MKGINDMVGSPRLIRCIEQTMEGDNNYPPAHFLGHFGRNTELVSPTAYFLYSSTLGIISIEDKGRLPNAHAVQTSFLDHPGLDSFAEMAGNDKKVTLNDL